MKHIVILEVIDEKNLTAEVMQEPPMVLTWWGMFFLFNRKTAQDSIEGQIITYIYVEIYGCALRSIKVSEVKRMR
ncbi:MULTISPECIES: hypothetical protein [unclassified Microcoleus]|uniref:hypothetical protein n=1 Tax=unclassified Microcoleus TaxID=2642155 RepID=UPI002FCF3881